MKLRKAALGPQIPVRRDEDGRVVVLEVPLTPLDAAAVREELSLRLAAGERGLVVFTPDAHASAWALLDDKRAALYRRADYVLCDGAGLAWSSRVLGCPVPRTPGVDTAWELCRLARELDWSVYLLGGRPGVAALAAGRLHKELPGIRLTGHHHGYFQGQGPAGQVSSLTPDLLLVGMGCPRQERWILEQRHGGAGILMGVGGALDLWAGFHRRAPRSLRNVGLEWAWRTLREPRRATRLWAIPFIIYQTGICRLRLFLQYRTPAPGN